jgi:hypothetical protein
MSNHRELTATKWPKNLFYEKFLLNNQRRVTVEDSFLFKACFADYKNY